MATPKLPKPKPLKLDVPDVYTAPEDTVESYKSYYDPKPMGEVNISSPDRLGAIEELKYNKKQALATKSRLFDEYNDKSTNWGDVIAETILTLAPTIAGYALDKNQGAIYGSNIGLQVGHGYRQNRQQEKEIDRYMLGQELQNADATISGSEKLLQDYLEKEWGVQDQRELRSDDREFEEQKYQNRRGDRLEDLGSQLQMRSQYGSGGAQKQSAAFQPSDAYIEELAQRSGKTVEEIRAALPKTNADAYAQVQFGDFMGNRPKAVGQGAKDQVDAGLQARYLLAEMKKDAALMANDPGILNAMKGGKLIDAYRVPGSPAERFYRNSLQLQKQIVKQNDGGRPTDKDFELMSPVVQGSPVLDTPESIAARLNDLDSYVGFKLNSVIGVEGATGRKTDKLQAMINGEGAFPSNSSGNDWLDRAEQNQLPVSSNVPVARPTPQQFNGDKAAYLQALQSYNNAMRQQHGQ